LIATVGFFALKGPAPEAGELLRFVGRFHTLLIHLPIGVLLLVASAEPFTLFRAIRERLDPMWGLLLPFLSVTACVGFTLGLVLAYPGGFPPNLLEAHKNGTFVGVLGCALLPLAWLFVERGVAHMRHVYRGLLLATVTAISLGAHHGGSMTRGEDYLVKYAPRFAQKWLGYEPKVASEEAVEAVSEPLLYDHVVLPILKAKCVKCHGEETQKGTLRVDTLERLLAGGDTGPAVIGGRGDTSLLVTRMRLPRNHDERMPPADEPDVSEAEISLVAFWIDRGANATLRVRDSLPPDSVRELLWNTVSDQTPGATTPTAHSATSTPTTPAATSGEPAVVQPSGEGGYVYQDHVAPVLRANCVSCHGENKQKGKLRVDSLEALLAGGKGGPAVIAGMADASPLLQTMRLPLDHPDHMPPRKEAQPTSRDVELIAYWVGAGASPSQPAKELPAKLRGATSAPSGPTPIAPRTTPPTPKPSASATVAPSPWAPTELDPEPALERVPANVELFEQVIEPMLVKRCGLCHEGASGSGGLLVSPLAELRKGGDSGPAVAPGQADQSLLVARVVLPLDSDEHMPPKDLAQLTVGEFTLLRTWITRGAKQHDIAARDELPRATHASVIAFAGEAPSTPAVASAQPSASPKPSSSAATISSSTPSPIMQPPGGGCAGCVVAGSSGRELGLGFAWAFIGLGALRRRHRSMVASQKRRG
jgi:mono/diheme cytochrome c family protein